MGIQTVEATVTSGLQSREEALIEELLDARRAARAAKDFARADAIRDGIAAAGVLVKDTPQGAVWEVGPGFDPGKLEALR